MGKEIIPARRLSTVSEYYFSEKLKEITDMNARGKDVINLGVGNPDLTPSKETIDVLCHSARQADSHGYQPYVGILELRQAFATWYRQHYRVNLNPKTEIQPLIGSKEGILHVSLAFLDPGDAVLVPNPGYLAYRSVGNLVEADVISYDLLETNNWQPDFGFLEKIDLSKVKLMWVNYPNMPTGVSASRQLFQKLVSFGKKYGIVICNDNPYSFILNESPLSILEIEGAKDICIELNSLSKSHNMPGWRIAMLASNSLFVQWVLKVKSNVDSGQFKPMMLAAVQSLRATSEWYSNINIIYKRRRKIAERIMDALNCTFDSQQSGMFLWGKIPDEYKDSGELSDKVLCQMNVFITPGFIFGSNGNRYMRISLCCKEERLEEALYRVRKFLIKK
ncbi:pyridoxal phosphate-dependent aminotransferase [Candidatus Azobacteroides pseudotrichonymphae]|uniref:Aminotransferase n=1 Tax=Azobacteroides pseudotrichonymphae genomovar. CFP2 TaxID=511995 RepID=B6YQG6_AZOPC|nr:aminotransferase class I/II-fold pyridoxal phosphate-dependent enzyme [Candidatus Azobacteroides pseudotrichonymphae]BAG83438.1 putative aspartate aminotransferase [Candidatus Azobacteroides pseudotrichonymphae genomovar. CFP2]